MIARCKQVQLFYSVNFDQRDQCGDLIVKLLFVMSVYITIVDIYVSIVPPCMMITRIHTFKSLSTIN